MSKVIGIVGSRRRVSCHDKELVFEVFHEIYESGDTIVSGGCPSGADKFAEQIAKFKNIPIKIHYPDWKQFGRGAGLLRNGFIARDADVLIAVVAPDRKGGTEDTIRKFRKLGKTNVIIIDVNAKLKYAIIG